MYVSHQLSKDRRKSWTITIIVHALLLLLFLLRLIVVSHQPPDYLQAITINFENTASKASGAEAASAASSESSAAPQTETQEVQTPREQVTLQSVATVQPSAAIPVPTRSISMTDPTPEIVLPQAKTSNTKSDKFFDTPLEVQDHYEVDRVEAFKEKPNPALQQKISWHVADTESSESGAPKSFDFANGQGSGSGTGSGKGTSGKSPDGQGEDAGYDPFGDGSFPDGKGKGTGNAGKTTGVGQDGKGVRWGDFAGDGLFNRKVIKRAPIENIADVSGKMVINLCVDQLGKVVFAQYDIPNSTIRDKNLTTKAEQYAKMYVFDEDPSAPREQCGRLTFIFEIKK